MKKLFFTAVALITFSGVSLAENSIIKKKEVKSIIKVDCIIVAINWLNAVDPDGSAGSVLAHNIYQVAYERCLTRNN
jgi:hypothetical protein